MSRWEKRARRCCIAVAGGGLLLAAPATAQQAETDLDSIIDASGSPDRAIALARTQEEAGDLLGAAKAAPNRVNYGSWFVGSPGHIGAAMLETATGTRMTTEGDLTTSSVSFTETALPR